MIALLPRNGVIVSASCAKLSCWPVGRDCIELSGPLAAKVGFRDFAGPEDRSCSRTLAEIWKLGPLAAQNFERTFCEMPLETWPEGRVEFAKIGCDIVEIWTFVWPVGRVVKPLLLLGFGEPREMRSSLIVAGGGCGARVGSPGRPSCLVPFPFPAGGAPVGAVWPPVSPPAFAGSALWVASLGLPRLGLSRLGL